MSCSKIRERLSDYIDGDLGPFAALRLRLHLGHCHGCQAVLDSLEATLRLLRSAKRREPPSP